MTYSNYFALCVHTCIEKKACTILFICSVKYSKLFLFPNVFGLLESSSFLLGGLLPVYNNMRFMFN